MVWQIRALWRSFLDLERRLVDLLRRVEALEQHTTPSSDDAQEG